MILVNDSPEMASHIKQFLERSLHTSFERLFISNFSLPVPWLIVPGTYDFPPISTFSSTDD